MKLGPLAEAAHRGFGAGASTKLDSYQDRAHGGEARSQPAGGEFGATEEKPAY
jgi:hypothetical protein